MATQTTRKSTSFKMEQAFALWQNKGKDGKKYFTGSGLIAFYNTMKKNPKEPDLRIYNKVAKGEKLGDEITSLWCNVSKAGKKYLTGKYEGKKVVAFINDKAKENQPYIVAYYSDSEPAVQQTRLEDNNPAGEPDANGDLPF